MSTVVSSPTKSGDAIVDRLLREMSDQIRRLLGEIKTLEKRIETLERKI